ncbi:MAG TPA: hypothetical protein VKF28_05535, partial [Candidatus Dormibacteraeota bacterium]|nr:hypothetical protein [Candidatus Dormibacteraeota bacterium]
MLLHRVRELHHLGGQARDLHRNVDRLLPRPLDVAAGAARLEEFEKGDRVELDQLLRSQPNGLCACVGGRGFTPLLHGPQ